MVFPINIIEESGNGLQGYSIADKLFEQNIILLENEINDEIATMVKAQLMYLDNKESCKEIDLYISSYGGSVYAGLGIIDIMNYIKTPVNTICTGVAMSMGCTILSSGTGKRSALPNSRIMIHSVSSGTSGTFHDMKVSYEETEFLQNSMMKLLAKKTNGKTSFKEMLKYTERDNYLSPKESIEIGLIDEIF